MVLRKIKLDFSISGVYNGRMMMKPFSHTLLALISGTALASSPLPIPDGYHYFGELPQPTPGIDAPQNGRLPVAVLTHGEKPHLIVLANGRLWFYINESKLGKILFSEPIELTDAEGHPVQTDYFYGIGGNKLMIHLAADLAVEAEIVGEDVPQLKFSSTPMPDGRTLPAYHAIADFDGDGVNDIVIGGADATTLYSALGQPNAE